MSRRSLLPLAALLAAAVLPASPAGAQTPTDRPTPGAVPGRCTDIASPASSFTHRAARRAGRRHLLRGRASDIGCGIDRVTIAVARKRHGRCRILTLQGRLTHRTRSCSRHRWIPVRGTTRWSFRFPRRLPQGMYIVQTRAIDLAGNVEQSRRHRVRFR